MVEGEFFNLGKRREEGTRQPERARGLGSVTLAEVTVLFLSCQHGLSQGSLVSLMAINKTLKEISHMWERGYFLLKMSESTSFKMLIFPECLKGEKKNQLFT